ncbi:BfmA/BtgA family mobilization protein [Tenacibaculum mesophilum]|uniref:BfmA/BtgA family mobilization protein n=1 Tax=Tenacibaculum mesophilum TaxID=104268 RepID=UPI003F5D8FD9
MSFKKSIIISERGHKELKKLASDHNRSIGGFTEEMILFFKKTGTDPRIIKGKSTTEMIKVIDRRIVSFFKTQEADILYPMRQQIQDNGDMTKELFEKLIQNLNKIFQKIKEQS